MRTPLKTLLLSTVIAVSYLAIPSAAAQTPSVETGLLANSVYLKNCSKCRGKTAEGRHFGGPALISAKVAAASADDLRNITANGKEHMPKFTGKLTTNEIDALVQQIQALNKK